MTQPPSDKSRGLALALAVVLGPFGGHRFYVGRIRSGIAMALTLGGFGIWYLYDLMLVAGGGFQDADGRRVTEWDLEPSPYSSVSSEVLDELTALRAEVAELAERVDFTERLLASPRPEGDAGAGPRRYDDR